MLRVLSYFFSHNMNRTPRTPFKINYAKKVRKVSTFLNFCMQAALEAESFFINFIRGRACARVIRTHKLLHFALSVSACKLFCATNLDTSPFDDISKLPAIVIFTLRYISWTTADQLMDSLCCHSHLFFLKPPSIQEHHFWQAPCIGYSVCV